MPILIPSPTSFLFHCLTLSCLKVLIPGGLGASHCHLLTQIYSRSLQPLQTQQLAAKSFSGPSVQPFLSNQVHIYRAVYILLLLEILNICISVLATTDVFPTIFKFQSVIIIIIIWTPGQSKWQLKVHFSQEKQYNLILLACTVSHKKHCMQYCQNKLDGCWFWLANSSSQYLCPTWHKLL